jgi:hypothetical protein
MGKVKLSAANIRAMVIHQKFNGALVIQIGYPQGGAQWKQERSGCQILLIINAATRGAMAIEARTVP